MSRLLAAVAIQPDEARLVGLLCGLFAAAEAGRGMGQVAVDALVLNRLGADALPPLYIGLGTVGLLVTLAYGGLLARARSPNLPPALVLALAGIIAMGPVLILSGTASVYPQLWIVVTVAGGLLVTVIWSVAGAVLDPRQAKRLFPLCTAAGIAGGFTGLIIAGPLMSLVGPAAPILVEVALLVVAATLLRSLRVPSQAAETLADGQRPGFLRELGAGAGWVGRSPLMRRVAVAYVLFAVVLFVAAKPYLGMMRESFPGDAATATATGTVSAAITGLSFLVAILVANRAYARFGLVTVALSLPVLYLVGFLTWLSSFTLLTAVGVQLVIGVAQRGLSNPAWSALFGVVPRPRRAQVLAFIDGVPGQVGTILSGALLIVADRMGGREGFLIGAAASASLVVVVWGIRARYGASLVLALRHGLAEQVLSGGRGLAALAHEPGVVDGLRRRTALDDAAERRMAAELLGELGTRSAAADLDRLAGDPDARVRQAALVALGRCGGSLSPATVAALGDPDPRLRAAAVTAIGPASGASAALAERWGRLAADSAVEVRCALARAAVAGALADRARPLVEQLSADADPVARAAAVELLPRLDPLPRDAAAMTHALGDPAPSVREAAIRAIGPAGDPRALTEALADASPRVRSAAATVVAARADGAAVALALLVPGRERAWAGALEALDAGGPRPRADRDLSPLRRWAHGVVDLAGVLRDQESRLSVHARQGTGPIAEGCAFVTAMLARRRHEMEALLVHSVAILAGAQTAEIIRRGLRSTDPHRRGQAMEALEALGAGGLARSVVRSIESAGWSSPDAGTAAEALGPVLHDPDPWVRAVALRTLARVRQAAEGEPTTGGEVLDQIDRMLYLRRVPLFATLGADDLQRIASLAVERGWAGGERLMTEGDPGDELIVLGEGSVRVVHLRPDGERLIRVCGPGDHIGELAVLRSAPRAATVIAEASGVRALVIGGAAIDALLRERPEAAMAMLATLAQRLGEQ